MRSYEMQLDNSCACSCFPPSVLVLLLHERSIWFTAHSDRLCFVRIASLLSESTKAESTKADESLGDMSYVQEGCVGLRTTNSVCLQCDLAP